MEYSQWDLSPCAYKWYLPEMVQPVGRNSLKYFIHRKTMEWLVYIFEFAGRHNLG
jgi:hypothetical protein